jgi:acetyl/propionyl-CoA carboxylase alpha subunit
LGIHTEKHVTFLKEIVLYKVIKKLTEETPSPFMTDELRQKMGEAAVKAAEYIKYEGRER